jgi:NAD-dependent deacetylase
MSDDVERAAAALRGASRVLVITGAGISADAGLPTYRGIGGLYNDEDTEDGMPVEEILTGEMLRTKPKLTWKYLHQIERAGRGAEPSIGHRILAEWEARFEALLVLTQNVDGLHRRAGSRDVVDIHGDFQRLHCCACDWEEIVEDYGHLGEVPECPSCGVGIRPDVVLFGEMLDMAKVARLQQFLVEGFDVVLSIGTSSLFPYIAGPVFLAARDGKSTIEVNPAETEVSAVVDVRLRSRAQEALPAIQAALGAEDS